MYFSLNHNNFYLLAIFFFCTINFSHGVDLGYLKKSLNKKSYNIIIEKCVDKKLILSPKCQNLIAISLLKAINQDTNNKLELQKEAFLLLSSASAEGNFEATQNLAWLYASGIGVGKNLKKSSDLYAKANQKITYTPDAFISKRINSINKKNHIFDYPNLRRAFSLLFKIDLYYSVMLNNTNRYISKKNYNKAKIKLSELIDNSKLSINEINDLKNIVKKEQDIIIKFLSLKIKKHDNKHEIEANNLIKELINISF